MQEMDYRRFVGSIASLTSNTWGKLTFESQSFTDAVDGDLVVTMGDQPRPATPLVRIHSECVFGEIFDSSLCDCNDQLRMALTAFKREGYGLLFYLRMDGRGNGLSAKVAATALEVQGLDTHQSRTRLNLRPEARTFDCVGAYLAQSGIRRVRLMTNNPLKVAGLRCHGIDVETLSLIPPATSSDVRRLYATKAIKFGHLIPDSAYKPEDEET